MLYDILVKYRLGIIAITANTKQASLQISVDNKKQNFFLFLWYDSVCSDDPNVIVYQFTRVTFGLIFGTILLNGTVKLHFAKLLFKDLYDSFIIA